MSVLKAKLKSWYFQSFVLSVSIAIFFGCTTFSRAQSTSTDIQISGSVLQRSVNRLGVNLSDRTNWDSGQTMKNLIDQNPGFEGVTYREILHCAVVSGNSCTDNTQGATQPSGFWNNGHFHVMSGTAAGLMGRIASSTAGGSCADCGSTVEFDRSLELAAGDYVSVEVDIQDNGDAGWSY